MCMGGGGGSYIAPQPKPRWLQDTSNEIIVSKYELSDENKRRNAARIRKRQMANKANKPPQHHDNSDDDKDPPKDTTTITKSGQAGIYDNNPSITDNMKSAYDAQVHGTSKSTSQTKSGSDWGGMHV